ncbi:MAG: acyl carrier protein [Calditrichaceae bacterium]|nr:phosphopantetheine-binding protein [Calditrichia bacterium]NUQ44319.1 acyl carrier protein [Calditrichaceae bacterium]
MLLEDNIEQSVKAIIANILQIPIDEIKLEDTLFFDLPCSDNDIIEVAMMIEEEFGIEISDEDFLIIQAGKIRNIIELIKEQLSPK